MNSKERVFARFNGDATDKIPNLNILMQFAAKELGVSYSEYCQNYKHLAQGNIVCAQKYGIDCVTVMSDPMREAHDVGTQVVFPPDDVPYPQQVLIPQKSDIKKLQIVKPEDGKRMSENVQTIQYYKQELGDDYPIFGWVEGCFAEAADLRGVNDFLIDLMEDNAFAIELLDFCLEQAILYAQAQVQAGADVIGVGDAIASVAGPHLYIELASQYERKLLSAIQKMGAKTKLHICGNTTPFLEHIPVDVIDIFDVDWMVPLDKATEVCGAKTSLSGNYDPVDILLQGTPESIANAVRHCAKTGNSRYISAAGCEVPKFTPPENLLAVKQTLEQL